MNTGTDSGRVACGIQDLRGIRGARFPVFTRDEPPGSGGAVSMGEYMALAKSIIAAGALCLLTAGCATGMAGSSRRICYDAGFQPGTQAYTDCWQRIRDQQFAVDGAILQDGIIAAAAVAAAVEAQRATPVGQSPPAGPWQRAPWATPQRLQFEWYDGGSRMCRYENGTVLNMGGNACPPSIPGQ